MPYVVNLRPMPAKAVDTEPFQGNLRFVPADRISRYRCCMLSDSFVGESNSRT